ncbi:acyl-CoA dehydrogenase family protein [Nocardioides sp. LS1]|uniref:acyl-CoA dehydrogenase family protein n=1 Tax=Nocardioides sp. LS1 TaxID=1027620 RepID=UPI000F61C3FB|nr:acyl-CoA dehydrogenase family protein [Nocardioides sp. LS1]GCD90149.1 acyl-CoA dehydrogenase [Nocardioides sp. LS1]
MDLRNTDHNGAAVPGHPRPAGWDHDIERLRLAIREMATRDIAPHVGRGELDCVFPDEVRAAMAAVGCFGRTLPVEFGGEGQGLRAFAAQQEELAKVWPTAAVAATWANLSGRLISRYGDAEQREELLPGLVDGTRLGAVAFTEPHGGSDAAGIRTTAIPNGDHWLLDGAKRMIDNAANAAFIVVSARSEQDDVAVRRQGISLFIVHRDDPGFNYQRTYRTLGLRAAGVGWFKLESCRIPQGRMLGESGRGFYQMMDMVEFGRIGVAAICLGMTEASLASATRFLVGRSTFGRLLSENDVILSQVADIRIRLDAARLLTERAAALVDAGIQCQSESAMAKVYASELAVEATAQALHLHGGIGYTDECAVEMHARDAHAFTIGEGTSEVLRMVVGRHEMSKAGTTA